MNKIVSEDELAAKATGRRVTLADVEGSILTENYFSAADGVDGSYLNKSRMRDTSEPVCFIPLVQDNPIPAGSPMAALSLLTFCVLVLKNGFTIVGKSACADPSNFNPDIGQRLAREDAVKQIWAFLGFELRSEITKENDLLASKAFEAQYDMTTYVGTKVIHARPMTRLAYNNIRGWKLPYGENGDDEGYLVEYTDRVENHAYGFRGYVSWSPKDIFERTYRAVGRDGDRIKVASKRSDQESQYWTE